MDYTKICFVVMPFGTKPVGKHKVNFDRIYDEIFKPAINAVALPEGGKLKAARTDKDFFSGDIGQEMFQYLNARGSCWPTSPSLNPNVMYEIGVRHAARSRGAPFSGRATRRFRSTSTTSRRSPTAIVPRRTPRSARADSARAARITRAECTRQSRADRIEGAEE